MVGFALSTISEPPGRTARTIAQALANGVQASQSPTRTQTLARTDLPVLLTGAATRLEAMLWTWSAKVVARSCGGHMVSELRCRLCGIQ